jgi:GntR family transcriptional regulator of arabinose operon
MKKEFLYIKVYEEIKNRIAGGIYQEGEKLPFDKELCGQFGVSQITLNKALFLLAKEGYVKRVQGRGTYVQIPGAEKRPVEKQGGQRLIGVILEHVSSSFGLDLMYHLDLIAERNGYRIIIRFSYGEQKRETEEIKFLLSMGVLGLLIMPSHGKHYSEALLRLCLNSFPVVLMDKKLKGIPVPSVRTNNEKAIAALVRELAKSGSRQIAFVAIDGSEADSVRERRNGYIGEIERQGLREAGICSVFVEINKEELIAKNPNRGVVYEVRKFLERKQGEVDAIIADEYGIVPGIIKAMEMTGITPEKDIRVACIDEDYISPFGTYFMHIRQDEKKIAEKSMEVLLQEIEGMMVEEDDFLITGLFFPARKSDDR